MKKKTKFLTILASLIGASTSFMGIAITSNSNNQITLNTNTNEEWIEKQFDAKLIGANAGTITLTFTSPNNCILSKIDDDFMVGSNDYNTDFNFNGGHFICDDIEYTITEIGDSLFNWSSCHKYFQNCILTIPSTIKKIGENAFNGCSKNVGSKEIIGLYFEEGLEYIGSNAFRKCNDIDKKEQHFIKFPNSLKEICQNAFSETGCYNYDLSALDHVIYSYFNVDGWWYGPFPNIKPIKYSNFRVKDKAMVNLYRKDSSWKNADLWYDK